MDSGRRPLAPLWNANSKGVLPRASGSHIACHMRKTKRIRKEEKKQAGSWGRSFATLSTHLPLPVMWASEFLGITGIGSLFSLLFNWSHPDYYSAMCQILCYCYRRDKINKCSCPLGTIDPGGGEKGRYNSRFYPCFVSNFL